MSSFARCAKCGNLSTINEDNIETVTCQKCGYTYNTASGMELYKKKLDRRITTTRKFDNIHVEPTTISSKKEKHTGIAIIGIIAVIVLYLTVNIISTQREIERKSTVANQQYQLAVENAHQGKWSECSLIITPHIDAEDIRAGRKQSNDEKAILYLYSQAQIAFKYAHYQEAERLLRLIDTSQYYGEFLQPIIEFKTKILPPLAQEEARLNAPICPTAGLGDTLDIAQEKLGGEISNEMLTRGVNHALASANNNKRIFNLNMSFGSKYKVMSWEIMDNYIPSDKIFVDEGYDRTTELYYCKYTSQSLAEKIPESEGKFILLQIAYGGDITVATGHEID